MESQNNSKTKILTKEDIDLTQEESDWVNFKSGDTFDIKINPGFINNTMTSNTTKSNFL